MTKEPQCPGCWNEKNPTDPKAEPVSKSDHPIEQCAWCGSTTRAGIYVKTALTGTKPFGRERA